MSTTEALTAIGAVSAIILSIWALVKAHEKPVQIIDDTIKKVQDDPVTLALVEHLAHSVPADILHVTADAADLTSTIAKGALTPPPDNTTKPTGTA